MYRKVKTVDGVDEDGNECQIPHEILTPVKLSRCKRTYCAKSPDLEGDFDSNHFDKDHLDNKRRIEDIFEELRLLWEKANTLKKNGIRSDEYVDETSKHSKDRVHLNSEKVSCKEKTKSHVAGESTFHKAPFADSNLKSAQETKDSGTNAEPKEHEKQKVEEPLHDKYDIDMDTMRELRMMWEKANKLKKCGTHGSESVSQPTTANAQKVEVKKEMRNGRQKKNRVNFNSAKFSWKEKAKKSHIPGGKSRCDSTFHENTPFAESDPKSAQETKVSDSKEQTDNGVGCSKDEEKPRFTEQYFPNKGASRGACKEYFVFRKKYSADTSVGNGARSETETKTEEVGKQENKDEPLHDEADGDMNTFQDSLINNREKLKETNEYKRAEEEEWASRQQALRLQAEEVRKMREVLKQKKKSRENGSKDPPWGMPDIKETGGRNEESNEAETETKGAGNQENKKGPLEDEADGGIFQESLINNREKLKETDEYKQAEKEEWASRQQALQSQAEEVRKQREALKRMKSSKVHDEADGDKDTFQDSVINNRENHKKTDEYKRAEEEEWASRQQALRLQAEEVRKIRLALKRKKRESLRAKDMERRQNQRVEEVRQTQKENEESMNMKEKLRAEVIMELQQLENNSLDMGSLLRALGVHVSGGCNPQPHEIRAAYRKALLSFHPDRAPASDLRGLVEAEEKFKLISRMKNTFLPTS